MNTYFKYVAIFVASQVVYYNAVPCGFVFDDASAVRDNADLRPSSPWSNLIWNDFWGSPMHTERSHKSYRPLCVLTFRLNYLMGELNPWGYHLVNNIFHGIVCVLYFCFCQKFVSQLTSFIATFLFTFHPVHTEAVTGVVGRAELMSSMFFLLTFLTYQLSAKHWISIKGFSYMFIALILIGCSMLSKEQGITVAGLCVMYDLFIIHQEFLQNIWQFVISRGKCKILFPNQLPSSIFRIVLLIAGTILLLTARIRVMGAQLPVFTKFDNPAAVEPTPVRQLTYNYLLSLNAWLLLCPSQLLCDWTMGTIPLVKSLVDPRNLGTLATYAVIFSLAYRVLTASLSEARTVLLALSLAVLPFIPASNLFFPVGFVVAERVLYLPSMGFSLLVATGFEKLYYKCNGFRKQLLCFLLGLLVITHSLKTIRRNFDWESEYTLFRAALTVTQNNAKCFNNVGHTLENIQKHEEALAYFRKAASIQPDDIGSHMNVGRALKNIGQFEEAETAYRQAIGLLPPVRPGQAYTARVAPNHLNVFLNLANLIIRNESRLLEADMLYRSAISMRSDYLEAYINRGDILLKLNRTAEAKQLYQMALQYDSKHADLNYNMGCVCLTLGQQIEAMTYFNKTLELNPNHKQALLNSANLIEEMNDRSLFPVAYKRLHLLLEMEPNEDKAYFKLSMLALIEGDFVNAEKWLIKTIELKDDFRSALFNLALMYVNDVKRPLQSIPYLEKLLHYYPDHVKGYLLLGDVAMNQLKNLSLAEHCFRQAIAADPMDVQSNHNLCVVFVEKNLLKEAEKCLIHAAKLGPKEEYIKQHLAIVRTRIQQQQQQQQAGASRPKSKP